MLKPDESPFLLVSWYAIPNLIDYAKRKDNHSAIEPAARGKEE